MLFIVILAVEVMISSLSCDTHQSPFPNISVSTLKIALVLPFAIVAGLSSQLQICNLTPAVAVVNLIFVIE